MTEALIIAFTTFFATIGPVDVAVVYGALSREMTSDQRWRTAVRAVFLASCLLFAFVTFWSGAPRPTWDIHTGTTYCWWHPVVSGWARYGLCPSFGSGVNHPR